MGGSQHSNCSRVSPSSARKTFLVFVSCPTYKQLARGRLLMMTCMHVTQEVTQGVMRQATYTCTADNDSNDVSASRQAPQLGNRCRHAFQLPCLKPIKREENVL